MTTQRYSSSPWCYDSDQDYYDSLNHLAQGSGADEADDNEQTLDEDCDYWHSNCYGRA